MFELKTPTPATLTSLTPRLEKHGDTDVLAVSLALKITAANTILDLLSPGLLQALYTKPDTGDKGPQTFEGFELSSFPLLRTSGVEYIGIKGVLEGWSLHVPYGINDDSALKFGGCKADKFKVFPMEGGTCTMTMRIGTSDVDEAAMGKLSMLLGDEVNITLLAPEKSVTIDGTQGAFDKDHPGADKAQPDLLDSTPPRQPDAGEAFAAAHGEADRGDGKDWPFPGGDDAGAGQAEAAAPAVQPASRSTKGKRSAAIE